MNCLVPRCGDSILDPQNGEACDDGAGNAPIADACRINCQLPRCGDGVLDTGERCDDGNTAFGDGCSSDCRSDETCGNAILDAVNGEECDFGIRGLSNDGCTSTCKVETEHWESLATSATGMPAMYEPGVAYDAFRESMVVFDAGRTWLLRQGTVMQLNTPHVPRATPRGVARA